MGRSYHKFLIFGAALLVVSGLPAPLRAQDQDDMQRGVARISLMEGEVSVRRGDSGDWVAGVINAPLLSDDRISTAPNSRAEVQFDSANLIRVGGNAELRLTQLAADHYQMELARGTVTYRILAPTSANVEVDTPSISVKPNKQGIYRITVNDAGETEVTVRAGEVEVFTPRGDQWVAAGQTLMARGAAADAEFQIVNAIPIDDWDRWCDSRDRVFTQSTSSQYIPPGVYGGEALDGYGGWVDVAPYGYVWRPRVAVGWAPYSLGRWAWEDWYGWTWVSYDPWGWAPYHYGRWFWDTGFGWCWYPGLRGVRHYWSPALVGFFGFGGGGGGFGFGHIGWVPLAPYETFHPWWGRGYYGRAGWASHNINITNVNITNVYRNARVANGISAVNYNDFRSGRFQGVQRFSGGQVREAGLFRGQMPVAPSTAHLRFSDRAVTNVPRTTQNARFFTHQQPNPAPRLSFAQQQSGTGSPIFNRGAGNSPAPQNGFNRGAGNLPGAQGGFNRGAGNLPGAQGGFNRGSVATPGGQNGATRGAAQGAETGGWRRFNDRPSGAGSPAANGAVRGPGNQPAQNMRPQAPQMNQAPAARQDRGGWQRFGDRPSAPQASPNMSPRGGAGNPGMQNMRPQAPQMNQAPAARERGGWQRFGDPGGAPRQQAPAPAQPRNEFRGNGSSGFGGYNGSRYSNPPQSLGISPPVVRERPSAPQRYSAPPSYSAPQRNYSAPQRSYSPPPSYSAPQRSYSPPQRSYSPPPSYSAPRSYGGGGNYSAPRSFGGGGGSPRSFGGGGGGGAPRSFGGGGGGGSRPSGGGGGSIHSGGGGHGRR